MYHIASSIRSKATRAAASFVIPTNTTSLSSKVYPKYVQQATLSLSMFATGTTLNNNNFTTTTSSSSSSNDQRRPFWATRPTEDETTKSSMVNSVDHNVKTAAATAGLNADTTKDKKEKAPKKATVKKSKKSDATAAAAAKDDDDDDEVDEKDTKIPTLSANDFMNTDYMAKVIAKKNDMSNAKAKRIVEDIFDMVIDGIMENEQVRVPRFGVFAKAIQKPKVMTNIQTKEKYNVPAKYRISFKASSILRKKASELEVP